MKEKQIQISAKLFADLVYYFFINDSPELRKEIEKSLDEKIEAIERRNDYTAYKTAETVQEREEARQRYLDAVGMKNSFRW